MSQLMLRTRHKRNLTFWNSTESDSILKILNFQKIFSCRILIVSWFFFFPSNITLLWNNPKKIKMKPWNKVVHNTHRYHKFHYFEVSQRRVKKLKNMHSEATYDKSNPSGVVSFWSFEAPGAGLMNNDNKIFFLLEQRPFVDWFHQWYFHCKISLSLPIFPSFQLFFAR